MSEESDNPVSDAAETPQTESAAGAESVEAEPASGQVDVAATDPLADAKAELGRVRDQLLRTAADFDNYRKRSRKEAVEAELRGREAFLKEILPVFDNLERAVAHAEVATDVQSLLNGIRMVVRQFADTLSRLGIERIPTVASQFDPAVHEAIQHLETDSHAPGVIAAEIQAGYVTNKRLIRPAMVVVAKAKGTQEPQRAASEADDEAQADVVIDVDDEEEADSPAPGSGKDAATPEQPDGDESAG